MGVGCSPTPVTRTPDSGKLDECSWLEDPAASGVADLVIDDGFAVSVTLGSDSEPVPFVVDTGSSGCAVSDWLARDLGLPVRDGFETVLNGEVLEGVPSVHVPLLTVAGLTFREVPAMILDVEKVAEHAPQLSCKFRRVGGVIGNDLLSQGRWQIDPQRGRLSAWGPRAARPDPSGTAIVINREQGLWLVDAKIGHCCSTRVALDLGSDGQLTEFPEGMTVLRQAYPNAPTAQWTGAHSSMVRGNVSGETTVARIPGLQLGELRISGVIVSSTTGDPQHDYPLLGTGVLEHFVLTLDWSRSTIWLAPTSPIPTSRESVGFGLLFDPHHAGLVVVAIARRSPAEEQGIGVGDQIVEIDGTKTAGLSMSQYCDWREKQPRGREERHTLEAIVSRNGHSRRLVLESRDLLQ